jgi:UDP-N-acetylglucosamine acyltransferase
MAKIHNTAIVDPQAELADSVVVSPYVIIGPKVKIGPETTIGPHTVIQGPCAIGSHNKIGAFNHLGGPPQHVLYRGEETTLEIGNANETREYVTIHRGTVQGGGKTVVGHFNFIMIGCHIAHDDIVGSAIIMANTAQCAGHVQIFDNAFFGSMCGVHQHARIGRAVMVGALTGVAMDAPPFSMVIGERAKFVSLNKLGMKRLGLKDETVDAIKQAYRILHSEMLIEDALKKAEEELGSVPEVKEIIDFYRTSERGVISR